MKLTLVLGISVLSVTLGCALAVAQEYGSPSATLLRVRATNPDADPGAAGLGSPGAWPS